MRVAIYARYSSDLQSPTSIEDQLAACRERAGREGWTIAREYSDAAISGSDMDNRPGLLALLADADRKQFDIVLAESLDRISRDQEHSARIHKNLTYMGIRLTTLAHGEVDKLQVGLRSLVASLFLDDLAHKTRRGLVGRLNAGKMPGGLCYGYKVAEGKTGEPEIVPEHAEIVRRIFAEYLDGRTPLEIATGLNRDGIPGPRGNAWSMSTISGSQQRANGIIGNRLYIGEAIYGRQKNVKDPKTGRVQKRRVPEAEWIRQPMPHLAIVDREIFEAVQKRRGKRCQVRLSDLRRPRHMLSGLVRCGVCGGNMIAASARRLTCSAYINKGTCDNRRTIKVEEVETRVLEALQRYLLEPHVVEKAVEAYRLEREQLAAERAKAVRDAERELASIERQVSRLLDYIVNNDMDQHQRRATSLKFKELHAQLDEVTARKPRELDDDVLALHQKAARRYAQLAGELRAALADPSARHESMTLLRELITRIVVVPTLKGRMPLQVEGALDMMLDRERAANDATVMVVPPPRIERGTSRSTI